MKIERNYPVRDIIIDPCFDLPGERKLQRKEAVFERTGELPEDIILNDSGVLIDGYTTYLTALRHGIEAVTVLRGDVEIIEAVHRGRGGRTYRWRVPAALRGQIQPGDKCLVYEIAGVSTVSVQNIVRQQFPTQRPRLRKVIKVLGRHETDCIVARAQKKGVITDAEKESI